MLIKTSENDRLNGAGDARPTALKIVEDNDLLNALPDKVILITGCSSGFGIETARALKATGAKLFVTARDRKKGEAALHDILEPGKVELLDLDLNSLESVRNCAAEFLEKSNTLNILINNAGIMALPTHTTTADGFEAQFGTNHLAHFLLFQLLKPTLLKSATPDFASRVVCVSSSGHRASGIHFDDLQLASSGKYSPWTAYGQSKTANIYMANEIDRRYGAKNLHAYSLHPGGIWTGLQTNMDVSQYKGKPQVEKMMKSVPQGAATQVWAAIDKEWKAREGNISRTVRFQNLWRGRECLAGPGMLRTRMMQTQGSDCGLRAASWLVWRTSEMALLYYQLLAMLLWYASSSAGLPVVAT